MNEKTQTQTKESFGFKWSKFAISGEQEDDHKQRILDWYGFEDEEHFSTFLNGKKVLDAGCGMGWRTAWLDSINPDGETIGVDIAEGAIKKARELYDSKYLVEDLGNLSFPDGYFDYIACEMVIHHTPDPQKYLRNLCSKLKKGGIITFYVYKEKPLVREMADKNIREITTKMSIEECLEFSKKMAQLGKALNEIDGDIEVPEIPTLGIQEGSYSVHSFIYQNLMKAFWPWHIEDEEHAKEIAVWNNFDWYHPEYAFTYSKYEAIELAESANLDIISIDERFSGYAIKARKL